MANSRQRAEKLSPASLRERVQSLLTRCKAAKQSAKPRRIYRGQCRK